MSPELTPIYNNTQDYLSETNLNLIDKAFIIAKQLHQGQKRRSGEDYVLHPLRVAIEISQLKMDTATIIAALLHDVLEDTSSKKEELKKEFGPEVVFLIDSVSNIHQLHHKVKNEEEKFQKQTETLDNLRNLILSTAKDFRVILIKLMDRLDNMRTIWALLEQNQRENALETLRIYVPIAYNLGLESLGSTLAELSFPYAYAREYKEVKNIVGKKYLDLEKSLFIAKHELEQFLINKKCPFFNIHFRKKKLYSIWLKYQKEQSYDKIYDIIALRVIVPTIGDCYTTLGLIHQLWLPLQERLKDYIALPKPNGYRALHTTVLTNNNQIIEIQIKTQEMYEYSEFGIASHWMYSLDKTKSEYKKRKEIHQKNTLLKKLEKTNFKKQDNESMFDILVNDILAEQIYVITPKGNIIDLPKGSTPIDFAYKIHTDIGNHCEMAKINNQAVPLNYKLQSGDIVEIITNKSKKPSRAWLEFVKMSETKKKINDSL